MATRAAILQRLSSIRTEVLLDLLSDEAIFHLAARYFESTTEAEVLAPMDNSLAAEQTKSASNDRAKRPLNAFMAFRSYYLKLFPDVQQKTASGFLTTLWNKDPFRNKWALVAKVYSFVRDQIGKEKVSLAYFLSLACPTMKIIQPSAYLNALGWSVREDKDGTQKLVRDESTASLEQSSSQSEQFPSTEIELLSTLIRIGYFPDQGVDLMERMSSNHSGIMATHGGRYTLPVSYTKEKIDFISTIRSDPIQAAKEVLGGCYDENAIHVLGVKNHNVENLDSISHISMQREYQDPRQFYNYASSCADIGLGGLNEPLMNFDNLPEYESFDIHNPFDLDEILGHTQPEGERSAHLDPGPQRNPLEDFHYAF